MKILAFGHIPQWAGGQQTSGLANVIYQLSRNIASIDNIEMTLAATDIYQTIVKHNKLTILGWSKKLLIKYMFAHMLEAMKIFGLCFYWKAKCPHSFDFRGCFFKMLFLRYSINKVDPQVIHLHGAQSIVYLSVIPRSCKILMTIHGTVGINKDIENYHEYKTYEKEVCTNRLLNKVVFVSSTIKDEYMDEYGLVPPDSDVILNAYDSNAFYYVEPLKQDKMTLCTIASISKVKGQERVIEAIYQSGLSINYFCIGSGTNAIISKINNLAKKYKVNFTYCGIKKPEEIRDFLARANFMIMPSSTEGFGLAYLESIACGIPVILPRNLPIVKEKGIIQPGVNSILLNDFSSESIIKVLLALDDVCFDHQRVSESVVNYSWENIAKEYVCLIKSLI